jgi:lysophospholipase L1-like esterase
LRAAARLRIRWRTLAALATLLAVSCAGGAGKAGTDGERGGAMRFLALGDSYTIGEGVAEGERWPARLAALLRGRGVEVADPEIVARTGWTTDELADAIDRARPRGPYALVTLLIGVNNQYRGRGVDEYRAQFRDLLERAVAFAGGEPGRVVVLSIPDWGVTPFAAGRDRAQIAAGIDAFNAAARKETASRGARWVDVTPRSRAAGGDPAYLVADRLHPSGRAYEEWARLALPAALAALGPPAR